MCMEVTIRKCGSQRLICSSRGLGTSLFGRRSACELHKLSKIAKITKIAKIMRNAKITKRRKKYGTHILYIYTRLKSWALASEPSDFRGARRIVTTWLGQGQ